MFDLVQREFLAESTVERHDSAQRLVPAQRRHAVTNDRSTSFSNQFEQRLSGLLQSLHHLSQGARLRLRTLSHARRSRFSACQSVRSMFLCMGFFDVFQHEENTSSSSWKISFLLVVQGESAEKRCGALGRERTQIEFISVFLLSGEGTRKSNVFISTNMISARLPSSFVLMRKDEHRC